jgi:tRNA(fMet)-specific endonuclease VapC
VSYALDTNIVVATLNGVAPVVARLATVQPADVLLPAPVIAELYFGARASNRVRENVARVDRLLGLFGLQAFDEAAARRFAEVKAGLRRVGRATPLRRWAPRARGCPRHRERVVAGAVPTTKPGHRNDPTP